MEKNEEKVLERNLEQKHFKNAAEAIKGGRDGSLTNVELVENLVESYKGKTVQAPIEVIVTSAIFLNIKELVGITEALKSTLHIKIVERARELREKIGKGEATAEDVDTACMLVTILKEEFEED